MNITMDDDLEPQLRELFDRQADAMLVTTRAWDDAPMAVAVELDAPRRSRTAFAAILSTAAAVALVIGLVAVAPGHGAVVVGGQPGAPAPVHFATRWVSLSADSMRIVAGGRHFTAGGSSVELNSDPGTPDKYTTLEMVWNEAGVEMRLNMYFTSDGHDWWANEIRTYDGRAAGDWIEYRGQYFRTPLGAAFRGNVNLSATDSPGSLQFTNLTLQPFLPPEVCKNATSRYVLDPSYEKADVPNDPRSGFGFGATRLLDAASCTSVPDLHAFTYDWKVDDPAVVKLDVYNGHKLTLHDELRGTDPTTSADVTRVGPGSTTLHVTARLRSTGAIVATADIAIRVR